MFTWTFAAGQQRWALDPGALRPLIDSYVADLASRGYEALTIHHLPSLKRGKFKAPDKLLAMFKEAGKGG